MSQNADPKSAKNLKASGIAFFGAGVAFLALGVTNRDMIAFTGLGAAFFALGAAMFAKARKADGAGE